MVEFELDVDQVDYLVDTLQYICDNSEDADLNRILKKIKEQVE